MDTDKGKNCMKVEETLILLNAEDFGRREIMRISKIDPKTYYDIPGYNGKYQINYYGNLRRTLKNGRFKELHPYTKSSNGRRAVKLNCKERVVMGLMRDTFLGKIPEGYVLYHKNGILTDDTLSNIGIATRADLGKLTGTQNDCRMQIVKISPDGEIVDCYRSAREAGRKNFMTYQTILDRINGKVKSLYAPDGYVYVRDEDREIQKAIRKIELCNIEEQGVHIGQAPDVIFDF